DRHLLVREGELRLHQLVGSVVLSAEADLKLAERTMLESTRRVQAGQLVELAREFAAAPANSELASRLLGYPWHPETWLLVGVEGLAAGGRAMGEWPREVGRCGEALPWYERAVAETEQGDVHGRVDHQSLGVSLHQVGFCHSSQGRWAEALPWFE